MQHKDVNRPTVHFIGTQVRIDRVENASLLIGALWDRFYREEIFKRVPSPTSDHFYGVYFDYSSDQDKTYSFLAGCAVTSLDDIPDGLSGVTAPAGTYAFLEVIGLFPDALISKWREIETSNLKRNFSVDYEEYGPLFHTEPPQINLYIGL